MKLPRGGVRKPDQGTCGIPRLARQAALALFLLFLMLAATSCSSMNSTPPPVVGISVSPPSPTLSQGAPQQFTATVTNTANTAVTWSIQEGAAGGAITNNGSYTAPGVAGTYHVIATSVADPSKTAAAVVTVMYQPQAFVNFTQLSHDTFSNASSQHATEVEPGAFAFGPMIVAAFQVGRIFSGGSADIGFAASTNGGASWTNGFLPGLTAQQGGAALAASDPSVAYDVRHGVWLISSLEIFSVNSVVVVVSRSNDGITWNQPITVSATPDSDKNWTVCDNTPTSPFFGNCYMEWDDPSSGDLIWMSTSSDGGVTWSPGVNPTGASGAVHGLGSVPQVLPNGTVVAPTFNFSVPAMFSFTSTDGGATWQNTVRISTISEHVVAGNLRTTTLPASAIDANGTVYVVWQDCRFRASCSSNDIVMSTSTDGITWTAPVRIPLDATTSTVDHFTPIVSADPATIGGSVHLGLSYYFYPDTNCTASTCALNVGLSSSLDGGTTWAAPRTLFGPMSLAYLPSSMNGQMFGDYTGLVFSGGQMFPVVSLAQPNNGALFNQAIFASPIAPFSFGVPFTRVSATERPVATGSAAPRSVLTRR